MTAALFSFSWSFDVPLLPGKKNIGHNVSEMIRAGHPKDQAVAASLRTAGVPPKKMAEKKKAPKWERLKDVEAFSTGKKRDIEYTPDDLKDIVRNFEQFGTGQRPGFDVPVVYGHEESPEEQKKFLQNTGIKADGWIEGAKTDGKKLYLDMRVSPKLADAIREGHYGTCSIEIYNDPKAAGLDGKGKVMRRLAVLGGEIPQDKNTKRLPMPERYSERKLHRRIVTTHLRDCEQFAGNAWVTCFSEVSMMTAEPPPMQMNMAEMTQKLAEHGVNPESLKTVEGCMAEMCRMAEDMNKETDWDSEPPPPKNPDEKKEYGELHKKMSAYAEKLKKYAEFIADGHPEDPIPEVRPIHPNNNPADRGLGGPSENVKGAMAKMSEEMKSFFTEQVAALRAELKPIKDRVEEDDQLAVLTFCEQQVKAGKLTPAMLNRKDHFNVIDELLELDNTQVVAKMSEGGREFGLTKRKKRMEQIKRGPIVWKNSEVARNDGGVTPGGDSEDREIAKIDRFCEERNIKEPIKVEIIEGFKLHRQHQPGITWEDHHARV